MKTFFGALVGAVLCSSLVGVTSFATPMMITPETAKKMNLVEASQFCRTVSAPCEFNLDGSACSAQSYNGWHLPSFEELGYFVGLSSSESYLWTRSAYLDLDTYQVLSLLDGSWGWAGYGAPLNIRCVR